MLQLHISLNVLFSADLVKKIVLSLFFSHSIFFPYLRKVHALPLMDTLCQYEMEHFICIETAILETVKVGTSLSTICWYVVHLLKNPTNGTFAHHEHTHGKLPALIENWVFPFILAHRVQAVVGSFKIS